jgi:hypothetical protein
MVNVLVAVQVQGDRVGMAMVVSQEFSLGILAC